MKPDDKRFNLIADTLKKPQVLIWIMLLPQLLLLALNFRAWDLARSEMTQAQVAKALTIGAFELGLLIVGLASVVLLSWTRQRVRLLVAAPLLLAHAAYLWLFTAWLGRLIPQSLTLWMLLPSQVLYYQYALVMPAVFFFGLHLAGARLALPRGADVAVTLAALLGVPLCWFLLASVLSRVWRWSSLPETVLFVLLLASTLLVLMVFLRALLFGYALLRRWGAGNLVLGFLAGLAAPIGGLLLNRAIPFPYDFQSPAVYALAVFNGMVLPDRKIDAIAAAVLGQKLERNTNNGRFGGLFTNRGRRGRWTNTAPPPPRTVVLEDVQTAAVATQNLVRASLTLTLRNPGSAQAEYAASIAVPDGVFVAGYWLDVAGERVPGRLFEKKTAMWVYHMIRDATRRDPGLLIYERAGELRLNVFPFAPGETRTTGIDFLFPAGLEPVLRVDDRDLPLEPGFGVAPAVVSVARDGLRWLVVPPAVASALPRTTRTPYLHVVADASAGSDLDDAALLERIAALDGPDAVMVTEANFEFGRRVDAPLPRDDLAEALTASRDTALPRRGALCPERAIKGALLDPPDPERVPLFVVFKADDSPLFMEGGLDAFTRHVPDAPAFTVVHPDGSRVRYAFEDGASNGVASLPDPSPVVMLRAGEHVGVCDAHAGGVLALPEGDGPIEVFDPALSAFRETPDVRTLDAGSDYARAAALWARTRAATENPAALAAETAGLVAESRESGILTPLTACIVVENAAQWKMLQRKERQALDAHQAMEFDEFMESPAPPILWLLPAAFFLIARRTRARHCLRE